MPVGTLGAGEFAFGVRACRVGRNPEFEDIHSAVVRQAGWPKRMECHGCYSNNSGVRAVNRSGCGLMTIGTYHITGDLPYFVVRCDLCTAAFRCYDDSCYQRDTLCVSASGVGWVASPDRGRTDRCPGCQRTGRPQPEVGMAGV